jgi:hypothetical protein
MAEEKRKEKNPSQLDKDFSLLGAEGFDATFAKICKNCPLSDACKKSTPKCNALSIVAHVAIGVTIGNIKHLEASMFMRRLKEAVASIKK